jgi:hypothetical protein
VRRVPIPLKPEEGNRAGPTLAGIFGRPTGTLPGYRFSVPLRRMDRPAGTIEEELVHDLTRIAWYKRRVVRAANFVYRADPLSADLQKLGITGVNDLRKAVRERRESLQARGTFDNMTNALARMTGATLSKAVRDMEDGKKIAAELQEILGKLHAEVKKCIDMEVALSREHSVFERAYIPEDLEKLVRIEATLDSRFQKNLQRLIAYQEFRASQKMPPQLPAA